MKPSKILLVTLVSFIVCPVFADPGDPNLAKVNQYFSTITKSSALQKFLTQMPKGGDLHDHLSGAIYPDRLIHYAQKDKLNWCVMKPDYKVTLDDDCHKNGGILLRDVRDGSSLDQTIISEWSMMSFPETPPFYGHDHFFASFDKFDKIAKYYGSQEIADLMTQAAEENINYLELMVGRNELTKNFAPYLDIILQGGKRQLTYDDIVLAIAELERHNFTATVVKQHMIPEARTLLANSKKFLACQQTPHKKACDVKVGLQYSVNRSDSLDRVLTDFYAGFVAATEAPDLYVGVNLVAPEDGAEAQKNYADQLQVLEYLRQYFKNPVHVSLHAGELNADLPEIQKNPSAMTFHIAEAINTAGADRIGHGVDIFTELMEYPDLISQMKKNQNVVEINLSSNEQILGVCDGESYCKPSISSNNPPKNYRYNHPFMYYLTEGVPVVLSTDDQGIEETNLTEEYYKAVTRYPLRYSDLKKIDENSLTYSFVPGQQLWSTLGDYSHFVSACARDNPYLKATPSASCQVFLNKNVKAQMEWNLEREFAVFEAYYADMNP